VTFTCHGLPPLAFARDRFAAARIRRVRAAADAGRHRVRLATLHWTYPRHTTYHIACAAWRRCSLTSPYARTTTTLPTAYTYRRPATRCWHLPRALPLRLRYLPACAHTVRLPPRTAYKLRHRLLAVVPRRCYRVRAIYGIQTRIRAHCLRQLTARRTTTCHGLTGRAILRCLFFCLSPGTAHPQPVPPFACLLAPPVVRRRSHHIFCLLAL